MVFSAALDAAKVIPANVTLTSAAGDQPITLIVSGAQMTATTGTPAVALNVVHVEGLHGRGG